MHMCVCVQICILCIFWGGFFCFFLEKLCHQKINWKERTIETNLMHLKVSFGLFEEVDIVEVVFAILKYFYQN